MPNQNVISTEQSVVGVFATFAEAEAAIKRLDKADFPIGHVSIIGQNLESEKDIHGYVTAGDVAKTGAATGAWVGGLFGLLIGAAFVWVPGFGPLIVAGPFAAAMLGGVEGAATGAAGAGLLGALIGWGVSHKHILKYEDHLRGGRYLVVVHGDHEEVKSAHEVLADSAPESLDMHTDETNQQAEAIQESS